MSFFHRGEEEDPSCLWCAHNLSLRLPLFEQQITFTALLAAVEGGSGLGIIDCQIALLADLRIYFVKCPNSYQLHA